MKIPSSNVVKFIQQGPKVSHVDDLNKALAKFDGYLQFPNGQKQIICLMHLYMQPEQKLTIMNHLK